MSASNTNSGAELLFLGTGTSMGVPTLGCKCAVCHSTDPHNNRMRSSIALRYHDAAHDVRRTVLIDTGQEFRMQAIRFGIDHLDAVLYTHGHADHVLGFDDLRPLTFGHAAHLPIYADDPTADLLERIFDYTFRKVDRYPTSARVDLHRLSSEPGTTVELFGAMIERIPVRHGHHIIAGYRFGDAAYLTDMSDLPEASYDRLRGLDIVVLDALRREPHPSHSHLDKSIAIAQRIGAKQTYFTHISHDLEHSATEAELPEGIHMAYDGLQLNFDIAAFPTEGDAA
ncbi:metal-dependent hydrolase, beta-lactamase superfamily I [Terriglobus roseus DSM 18391]|uniref:Metal-dependent hydrolase, beta-lactamase superfamily I n=1 Tax=Terriglobus roseus (strain DSM 18391 / NRRL B-41598 / KBS 63) TaxID=926566 RepID=I3ZL73_TERRK|nr:MBL fold metallo-hydrolase [Terriglobus roseus]AFL89991.1 metal-dependent hydrolase, beta-lactamase superfamily I [Terriglobus roseus DSM 18391]